MARKLHLNNCNHNLVHQLAVKLDSLWRYDTYIKDAKKEGHNECVRVWEKLKKEDAKDVELLRKLVVDKCKKEKFC